MAEVLLEIGDVETTAEALRQATINEGDNAALDILVSIFAIREK